MPGVMPKLKWEERGKGALALVVPPEHAALIGERPAGRLAQLSKLLGRPMEFAVGT